MTFNMGVVFGGGFFEVKLSNFPSPKSFYIIDYQYVNVNNSLKLTGMGQTLIVRIEELLLRKLSQVPKITEQDNIMKKQIILYFLCLLTITVYSQSNDCWKEVLVENANVNVCLLEGWYVDGSTSEVGDHATNAKIKLGKVDTDSTLSLKESWKETYHDLEEPSSNFELLSDTLIASEARRNLYVNFQKVVINEKAFKFCSGILCLGEQCVIYESLIPFEDNRALGFVFQVLSNLNAVE